MSLVRKLASSHLFCLPLHAAFVLWVDLISAVLCKMSLLHCQVEAVIWYLPQDDISILVLGNQRTLKLYKGHFYDSNTKVEIKIIPQSIKTCLFFFLKRTHNVLSKLFLIFEDK